YIESATTEIYTLSLHDALPIFVGQYADRDRHHAVVGRATADESPRFHLSPVQLAGLHRPVQPTEPLELRGGADARHGQEQLLVRSEEHTSELQSRSDLVCRLLL